MRNCRINLPNRRYHLIGRVAHRAFEFEGLQAANRKGCAAMTRKTYCGNLLWQSGLTLLAAGISSWQFWAYSALTTLDCASAPVAMVLGGLVGEAVYPAGGGVIGAIIGATPAGDAVIDVAAMALQNMVSQGTPLPMSQGKSCCNLIMTAVSELWGFEDSAGCECQKYSNP